MHECIQHKGSIFAEEEICYHSNVCYYKTVYSVRRLFLGSLYDFCVVHKFTFKSEFILGMHFAKDTLV